MTSCIHFIRHGITEGIKNKWYYGWVDLPLIQEGVDELEKLRDSGIYPSARGAQLYTSGMTRANQTLEVIYGQTPYRPIENLKEMNFGKWECKTFDELKELDGFETWVNDTSGTFTFPEGESSASFYARATEGLNELIGYHRLLELSHRHSGLDSVSIAVCHGGVIAASMCTLFEKPADTFWQWIPAPGRGYTAYFRDGKAVSYSDL